MVYYKTTIIVEILTDEQYTWNTLGDVAYDIVRGSASDYVEEVGQKEISAAELEKECEKHHTDPSYFTDFEDETD